MNIQVGRGLHAVVTAGATLDGIDDVRVLRFLRLVCGAQVKQLTHVEITNIFHGRFGWNLARALAKQGVRVTLLGSREALQQGKLPRSVLERRYDSFGDLNRLLGESFAQQTPDIIFMSAAVADYSPTRVSGKIASSKEKLLIELTPNAKLLDGFRTAVGAGCTIVGSKVLSGVPDQVMHEYQTRQIARANTDFCVGNDLARCDFAANIRRLRILSAQNKLWRMTGGAEQLADRLVEFIVNHHLKHHPSV